MIQQLPDAVAIVSHTGETLESNRALAELAARCKVSPQLSELFGTAFTRFLTRSWVERHLQTHLRLVVGPEPRPTFRISFLTAGERTLGVLLRDVSSDLAMQHTVNQRDRQLAMLRDVALALSGAMDVEHLTELLHRETSRVLPSRSVYIALYDPEADLVTFPRYMEEGTWKNMTSRPFANGLTEYLLRTGAPLLLNHDVREQAEALGIEPQGRPSKAWLGAPMIAEGETIGIIALQDFENADVYDEHDLQLLTVIASQAATAVKHARALSAERRAPRELAEAQARLLETERLRGVTETVGALNHEINNPLAAIAGNAQLLRRRPEDLSPAALTKIETIHEAALRIQRVTGKMASLIHASALTYPGQETIIDVHKSVARGEPGDPAAGLPPADDAATPERPLPPIADRG